MDLNIDINSFFDKIKSKTTTVAINISARSEIEVLEFDKNGLITNYTNVPIQYNQATKEFENVNDLESAIKRAFSELNINLSSRVYVSIPTFMIENEQLPNEDNEEAVKSMLLASAEKNYFFKKYDPAIAYYKTPVLDGAIDDNVMSVTYAALRASELEKIKTVLDDLGLKVMAVDASYSAIINGVIASQRVNPNVLNNNGNWKVLYITSNSYMLFSMQGRNFVNIYDEPLAVKSFTDEEVYQAISNSLDLVLDKNNLDQMVIVSQSDQVSAEYLASILNIDTQITYIEDNKYRKQLVELGLNITQSNKTKVSLEAVGITSWLFNDAGFKFNFIDGPSSIDTSVDSIFIPLGGKEIELTPEKMKTVSYIFGAILAVILVAAYGTFYIINNGKEVEREALVQEVQQLEKELNMKKVDTGISEAEFLQKAYTNNVNFLASYKAFSQEIPDMVWIEEIQIADDSNSYIAGRSYRIDDVLNYFDSLNDLGKFPNLKISTLKISNTPISDLLLTKNSDMTEETTYEFAFGNKFFVDPRIVVSTPQDAAAPAKVDVPLPPSTNTAPAPAANNTTAPPPTNLPKENTN